MAKSRRSLADKMTHNIVRQDRRADRRMRASSKSTDQRDSQRDVEQDTRPVVMDITRGTTVPASPEMVSQISQASNEEVISHSREERREQRSDTDALHMSLPVTAPAAIEEVHVIADEPALPSDFAHSRFTFSSPVNLSVTLPREIAEEYVRQADAAHKPLSDFLADRLANCITHSSRTQLVITDAARLALGRMLASALTDEAELIRIVRGLVAIRVRSIPGAVDVSNVPTVEFTIDMSLARRAAAFVTSFQTYEQIIEQFCRRGLQQLFG